MSHGSLPSKERLAELREKGDFPFSTIAVRASVMLAVVITAVVSFRVDETMKAVALLYEGNQWQSVLDRVSGVAILLCSTACGSALLMALFQTRGRLYSPRRISQLRSGSDLGGICPRNIGIVVCAVFAAAVVGALTFTYFIGDLFLLFRRDPRMLVEDTRAIVVAVSRVLIVVGGVLAILGVVGARVAFIFKHRSKEDSHKG
jgi:flagellar biosynthesis protein FlhB